MILGISRGEMMAIGTDFSRHVGEGKKSHKNMMGKFGVQIKNAEPQMVMDFAKRIEMAGMNILFQKIEDHRVTYKSGE